MFREQFSRMPIEMSLDQIAKEEKMREDAQNQFRLAVRLYSRFHGMRDAEGDDFGDAVIEFWKKEDKDGNSYSDKYRTFVESEKFRNDPRLKGNLDLIELEDFI